MNMPQHRKETKMAYYSVRTTYHFDQIVEADTPEQAMLKGEDTQPSASITEDLGLIEVDRTAENEPVPAHLVFV
jgi:hypothetical protein